MEAITKKYEDLEGDRSVSLIETRQEVSLEYDDYGDVWRAYCENTHPSSYDDDEPDFISGIGDTPKEAIEDLTENLITRNILK